MDKLSLFILPNKSFDHPLVDKVRQRLNACGIECTDQCDQDFKCVLILWADKLSPEGIMQVIAEYYSKDFKVILLNIGNTVPDSFKWQLIRSGARDCIDWKEGNDIPELLLSKIKRWKAVEEMVKAEAVRHQMIGDSLCWKRFLRKVVEAAYFTNNNILLTGESGTGKELTAKLIHSLDRRKEKGGLVLLDCTTVVPELSGSEFYGHEKGAFTGAAMRRTGRFELANGGTIFLDEVAELPLELQPKLLRVLQEGEYEPVGSSQTRKVDVRVIAATNRDLTEEVKAGRFREDLYYRLHVFPIAVPPLRDRACDVEVLAERFLARYCARIGRAPLELTADCLRRLRSYHWPGNVRELENVIERAVIITRGERLALREVLPVNKLQPTEVRQEIGEQAVRTMSELRELERETLVQTLEQAKWKVTGEDGAARRLGVPPSTLFSRMKALRIQRPASSPSRD